MMSPTGPKPSVYLQFSSVTQSCQTLCDPIDCSTPGHPVHHQLPEFTHTRVHRVGDASQPSHPLPSPSPVSNISQHQGLFQWISCSHQVAKSIGASASASVLPRSIHCWFPLRLTDFILLPFKGRSRIFSSTTAWKHQFFGSQPSLLSSSHICTWLLERP